MAFYKKFCIHCNALIEGDSNVCPSCGSHSPFANRCYSCGREINRNEKWCSGCGRPLYLACPVCKGMTFLQEKCEVCGANLMITCTNPRCGASQFFDTVKCTACGKKIKRQKITKS